MCAFTLVGCGGTQSGVGGRTGTGGTEETGGSAPSAGAASGGAPIGGTEPCLDGTETCPCYGNDTCNDGLTCASGLCVDLVGIRGHGGVDGAGGSPTGGAGAGGATGSGGNENAAGSPAGGAGGVVTSGSGGGGNVGGSELGGATVGGSAGAAGAAAGGNGGIQTIAEGCLRVALLGRMVSAANNTDVAPFLNWLSERGAGTITVALVETQPELDADFLNQYDVLVVTNVNGWAFDATEQEAVRSWVEDGRGGLITLAGFESTSTEPGDSSQLLEPFGLRYTSTEAAGSSGQTLPVYYQGGTTDLKICLAWTGSTEAMVTTPVSFAPQTGSLAPLTHGLDYVGAFLGFGVEGPADAGVVARDPVSGQHLAVAHEVGDGRVFAFGDEWILFANQWDPAGLPGNTQEDQYNQCWVPPEGGRDAFFHSVATLYQTRQFWYNALYWVTPRRDCRFVIEDELVRLQQ